MNSFFLPPKPYYSFTRVSSALRTCIPPAIKMSTSVDPPEPILLQVDYPKPLSPPLPAISKEIELGRAMSASSRSSLFSLSASHVLYEDQWLMVVDKPQGIYCESVLESVPSLLLSRSNNDPGRLPEIHLANRLDRDTSGVMVITKSHKVAAKLVKAFTDHKVRKTYIALCIGSAPDWNRITMKSGHGRSKFGAWRVYAASDVGRGLPGGSSVREMETSFEVLSVNGNKRWLNEEECCGETVVVEDKSLKCDSDSSKKQDEILVRAFPRSGRTHQIRLHCQYLGLSIRGDVKYEGVHEWEGKEYSGHQLHAESLSFEHPVTGLPIKVHAPLPSWVIQLSPQQL
ncbi:RNA pseudouridine synthase 1 [Linum perenne]